MSASLNSKWTCRWGDFPRRPKEFFCLKPVTWSRDPFTQASDRTCENSTTVLSCNHDTHWQLHENANTDRIYISLSWQHARQLWFHTPPHILIDVTKVNLTIFLSVHFPLKLPQSDFTYLHTHTHSVSSLLIRVDWPPHFFQTCIGIDFFQDSNP